MKTQKHTHTVTAKAKEWKQIIMIDKNTIKHSLMCQWHGSVKFICSLSCEKKNWDLPSFVVYFSRKKNSHIDFADT